MGNATGYPAPVAAALPQKYSRVTNIYKLIYDPPTCAHAMPHLYCRVQEVVPQVHREEGVAVAEAGEGVGACLGLCKRELPGVLRLIMRI
jgi:hypothetical protein